MITPDSLQTPELDDEPLTHREDEGAGILVAEIAGGYDRRLMRRLVRKEGGRFQSVAGTKPRLYFWQRRPVEGSSL